MLLGACQDMLSGPLLRKIMLQWRLSVRCEFMAWLLSSRVVLLTYYAAGMKVLRKDRRRHSQPLNMYMNFRRGFQSRMFESFI